MGRVQGNRQIAYARGSVADGDEGLCLYAESTDYYAVSLLMLILSEQTNQDRVVGPCNHAANTAQIRRLPNSTNWLNRSERYITSSS